MSHFRNIQILNKQITTGTAKVSLTFGYNYTHLKTLGYIRVFAQA